jgi:hypothetical protein
MSADQDLQDEAPDPDPEVSGTFAIYRSSRGKIVIVLTDDEAPDAAPQKLVVPRFLSSKASEALAQIRRARAAAQTPDLQEVDNAVATDQ